MSWCDVLEAIEAGSFLCQGQGGEREECFERKAQQGGTPQKKGKWLVLWVLPHPSLEIKKKKKEVGERLQTLMAWD